MTREQARPEPGAQKVRDDGLWVDGKRLAQQFDLSMPQLAKRLRDLGLKKGTMPTDRATQDRIAQFVPQIRGRASPRVQWHLGRAGEVLARAGLVPLDEFALFCRVNGDMVQSGLHTVTDEHLPHAAHNWFITHQISLQMDCVPGGKREAFIDDLVKRLANPRRGPATPIKLVHAMLDVLGHLDRHLARRSASELSQDTAPASADRALARL